MFKNQQPWFTKSCTNFMYMSVFILAFDTKLLIQTYCSTSHVYLQHRTHV